MGFSQKQIVALNGNNKSVVEIAKEYDLAKSIINSKVNLSRVQIFHTDRGSEFNNAQIDELLSAFNIKRSLSAKGNPWDNAVSEALYKTLKTEFVDNRIFSSQWQLQRELTDYINWYNSKRLHSSLGYVAPLDYVA